MLIPSVNATIFVDNHDTERSQTDSLNLYQDGKSFDLAMIYMLGQPYARAQLQSGFLFTFNNTTSTPPPRALTTRTVTPSSWSRGTSSTGGRTSTRWWHSATPRPDSR